VANFFSSRLSVAIDYGERSLARARELGLREEMAHTLNDLGGLVYLYSGRIGPAIAALQEAGELWRQLRNTPMLVDSLCGSCIAQVFAGDYDQAIALSEQASQVSRFIDNLWGQSYSRWNIGDAYRVRGEYSRAIEASEECIRLGERAGFLASQTSPRVTLAGVYADLGAFDQGVELATAALTMAKTHGLRVHMPSALGMLAHLYALRGDLRQAEMAIDETKEAPYEESWTVHYLVVLRAEAELALSRVDYSHALAVTDDLLARLRRYGMRLGLPEALYWQGKALLGLGQRTDARERFLQAQAQAENVGSRRTLWRVLVSLSEFEGDPVAAGSLRTRAQEILATIAANIHKTDLRTEFLDLPDVRALLHGAEPDSLRVGPQKRAGEARGAPA
jgi:tetratricopeptide (TPR) repeat protein